MEIQKDSHSKKVYRKISRFRRDAIINFIDIPNAKILDIGCADGSMGMAIKNTIPSIVYGLDISKEAVEIARKRLDDAHECDIENWKFEWLDTIKRNKYDYIILSEVLEHTVSPENILSRVQGILNREGYLLVTTPNILFWKNRMKMFLGKFEYTEEGLMDHSHVHFFSWRTLVNALEKAGFEIVETNHHAPTRGTRFFRNMFPGFFAYQFILKARPKK